MPVKEDTDIFLGGPNAYNGWFKHRVYREGTDTPQGALARGQKFENPYYVDSQISDLPLVTCWNKWVGYRDQVCNTNCLGTPKTVSDPLWLDVLPELMSKWKQSDFNVGVSVAEGKESARLIGGTLTQLWRALGALRRLNLPSALSHLSHVPAPNRALAQGHLVRRDLVSTWLELRYGWRPLLSDINAAWDSLSFKPHVNSIRTSHTEEAGWNNRLPGYEHPFVGIVNEKRKHVKVTVSRDPNTLERYGLTDPLTIAWELVPYSFVVDWFIPIGATLESLHAVRRLPVTSVTETNVRNMDSYGMIVANEKVSYHYRAMENAYYREKRFNMDRNIYAGLPSELAVLSELPQKLKPLWDQDLLHMADMAALVIQRLRGLRSFR